MGLDPAIADAYFDRLEEERAVNQVELQELRPEVQEAILTETMLRRGEERAAAVRAFLEEWQELRPEDRAAIQAGPVFTPMTVLPEIRNRREIQTALIREYPPDLRDAGIGGQVVVWYYVSETGQVLHARVSEGSGQAELDAAALRIAVVFRFTPATNRDEPVPVWIQLPITFQAN